MATKRTPQAPIAMSSPKTPFLTPILVKVAECMGAHVMIEPTYGSVGCITFRNGNTTFFRGAKLDINPLGATEVAKDKGYTSFFLAQFGFSVPEEQTFFSDTLCRYVDNPRTIDDAFLYATSIGYPVIIKPNQRSQGILVTKIYNKRDFYRTARAIFREDSVMLVQKFYAGNDYRILVLDDEVVAAYQRIPLYVVGNGFATVRQLLMEKQELFNEIHRGITIDIDDFRIVLKLRRQKLTLDTILAQGKRIHLLDNANLSDGGDAVDLTQDIHQDWVRLCVDVAKKMGLRLCGVDIITQNIAKPMAPYIIIETNASPGLRNYASIGNAQVDLVEKLYTKVLQAIEKA